MCLSWKTRRKRKRERRLSSRKLKTCLKGIKLVNRMYLIKIGFQGMSLLNRVVQFLIPKYE